MQDRHSGTLELRTTSTVGAEASDVWLKLLSIEEARGLDELALGAPYAQFAHQKKYRDGDGKGKVHERADAEILHCGPGVGTSGLEPGTARAVCGRRHTCE